MGPGDLTDRVTACQAAPAPRVHVDAAVHVLVADVEGQGPGLEVVLVHPVQLDGQRVHVPQALDRQLLQGVVVLQVGAHVRVEFVQAERPVAGDRPGIALEVHQDGAALAALDEDRQVHQAGAVIRHARGVEGPLVALAEDVGSQFARGPVVIGQEIVFAALRIHGMDVGDDLHVGPREVPWELGAPGADAELALGQVADPDAGLDGHAQRAEAVLRVDAVAVQLAGPAGGQHQAVAQDDLHPVCVVVAIAANGKQAPHAAALLQYAHAGGAGQERDIEPDGLLAQYLDHQPRGARPAAGGAAHLVVVGLVAQHRAEAVLRQGQAQVLQSREGRDRADRLDVGGVGVHGAAGADVGGELDEIIAAVACTGGVNGLLVRARAGGSAGEQAGAAHGHLDTGAAEFHRGPQAGGAAAQHQGLCPVYRDVQAADFNRLGGLVRPNAGRHFHARERVEDFLCQFGGHRQK